MLVEYIWSDVNNIIRSKTRMHYTKEPLKTLKDITLPVWHFDGSETGQTTVNNSELYLKPQIVFKDPFRGNDAILVVCDVYDTAMTPHVDNVRYYLVETLKENKSQPVLGFEQEFYLEKNDRLLGLYNPKLSLEDVNQFDESYSYTPEVGINNYCGVGAGRVVGRECVEQVFKRCQIAGISVTGMNSKRFLSQWEIQLCSDALTACDQLVILRYILNRTAEMYGLTVNYSPKPHNEWSGSGCHINYSDTSMRDKNGYDKIVEAIEKLENNHLTHIKNLGTDNELRLTGNTRVSDYNKFSWGVGDRAVSVRIPSMVSGDN